MVRNVLRRGWAFGVFGLLVILPLAAASSGAMKDKQILMLTSYGDGRPGVEAILAGLQSVLNPGGLSTDQVFVENLDLERAQSAAFRASLAGTLRLKYAGRPLEAIYIVEQPALEFLLGDLRGFAPAATFFENMDRAILDAQAPFEWAIQGADGQERRCEVRLARMPAGGQPLVRASFIDITGRIRAEAEGRRVQREREATVQLLRLLNQPGRTRELVALLTQFLQEWTGCAAVGIRLQEGEDFPYFETRGLPQVFVQKESSLCTRDSAGRVLRDASGNPVLECMCGNILSGRFDPALPFFTAHGSFWTNSTTELLAGTTEAERQSHTRNRCNAEGYESVALIPLRSGDRTFGLLQLNDFARGRFTPEWIAFLERVSDQIGITLSQREAHQRDPHPHVR